MLAPARTAVRLALADAVHEWRMSLCLILAVAAIAAPLLLFFGLKYGTVDTLRKRLLNNPATLELLPVTEKLLDAVWFETRRADPRVAFLVPHTRKLSAQADVVPAGGGATKRLDLHPSLPGDTLLSRFGLEAPAADTCVLTSLAAERLNAKTGDRLAFTVTREQGRSKASHTFEVRGVLPARAGSLAAAYIPLDQLEAVEDYKDGRAVPAFGWPGNDPVAHSVAQAVLLAVPVEFDARQRASVQLNTGFTGLEELGRAPLTQAGLPAQLPGAFVYRLRCVGRGATQDNLLALRDKLRGLEAICVPLFGRMTATLPDGETLALTPVSGQESPALREALNNAAPLEQWTDFARRAAPRVLLVPPSKQAGAEALVTVSLPDSEGTELRFRVALAGAQSYYGVEPDLTCLGKIIGGGMPVGAFGGRKDVMDALAPTGPVYQAGTLSGNPIAMAAGFACLTEVAQPGIHETLTDRTTQLANGLLEAAEDAGIPLVVNHVGGMFGIFFTDAKTVTCYQDVVKCDVERFKRFFHLMLEEGVYLAPSAFEAGFMSVAHSEEDINNTIDAARKVFAKL